LRAPATERAAIIEFVRQGGRVLVVAEEERRTNLDAYGIRLVAALSRQAMPWRSSFSGRRKVFGSLGVAAPRATPSRVRV